MAKCYLIIACIFTAMGVRADENKVPVVWDGFVDTYYAYDFNGAGDFDRSFTTQPARSDEFNVNLGYVAATVNQPHVRGRFALQAGTSVQSNYSTEPTNGAVSGSSLSRNIQEAYIGVPLAEKLWIDAGIYFSHVGSESFISRDNLTYTRSLVADFSPYYQSGVKLSYQPSEKLGLQLHVINGWQNVSENNHSKSIGTQIAYTISPQLSITYNTIVGREAEFRHFHDFIAKFQPSVAWSLVAQYDLGFQRQSANTSIDESWQGITVMGQYKLSTRDAVVARVEEYDDNKQIIVTTKTPNGFQVKSASLGFDRLLAGPVMWRSEARLFWSRDAIYPASNGPSTNDQLLVTSLSASF